MANDFAAAKEADKINQIAEQRLSGDGGKLAAMKLVDEWASMNQQQRNAVAAELQKRDTSNVTNDLPHISAITDRSGNVTGLVFTGDSSDLTRGVESVAVRSDKDNVWEEAQSKASLDQRSWGGAYSTDDNTTVDYRNKDPERLNDRTFLRTRDGDLHHTWQDRYGNSWDANLDKGYIAWRDQNGKWHKNTE